MEVLNIALGEGVGCDVWLHFGPKRSGKDCEKDLKIS